MNNTELLSGIKAELRRKMLSRQRNLSDSYVKAAGERIQSGLLASSFYAAAERLFCYVSLPKEPPTRRILSQALKEGKQVYVPKCTGNRMLAVRIRELGELVPGMLGIPEPVHCGETVPAEDLDLILVPCVSASPDGRRLGHGGGYYDRFLEKTASSAVCLCFDRQLCADIPMGENDILIPHLLTETLFT